MQISIKSPDDIARCAATLSSGELVVMRTDSIYGILCRADGPRALQKLYAARQRDIDKPCIILVPDAAAIPFSHESERLYYQKIYQDRPTTVVISVDDDFLPHLPRIDGTLAFRIPAGQPDLISILRQTGALLAPSANIQGLTPAKSISDAQHYFQEKVALYVDGGLVTDAAPSRIIAFENGQVRSIRQ